MDASSVDRDDDLDGAPRVTLAGFNGPLSHLLTLARAQKIDLSNISLTTLIDQLATALREAPAALPLGWKGDWVVMAAWLLQLRSLLLLPADAPAQQDAAAEANQLRGRLVALQETQALVAWLERRPLLGHDIFARGHLEAFSIGTALDVPVSDIPTSDVPGLDVIEFLWASMALFDDDVAGPDTATVYRPAHFDLYVVAEARDRIMRLLRMTPEGAPFERLLPESEGMSSDGMSERSALRRRSARSSTFVASLELARQGDVVLGQRGDFQPIHIALATPP